MRKYRKAQLVLHVVRQWADAEIERELAAAYPDLTQDDLSIIAKYGLPTFVERRRRTPGDGVAGLFFRRVFGIPQSSKSH